MEWGVNFPKSVRVENKRLVILNHFFSLCAFVYVAFTFLRFQRYLIAKSPTGKVNYWVTNRRESGTAKESNVADGSKDFCSVTIRTLELRIKAS